VNSLLIHVEFERFSGILTVESGRAFSDRLDQLFFHGRLQPAVPSWVDFS